MAEVVREVAKIMSQDAHHIPMKMPKDAHDMAMKMPKDAPQDADEDASRCS